MTQASLPIPAQEISAGRAGSGEAGGRQDGLTLWLFGLTAMTLVFASLLVLGLLAQAGVLGSSVGAVAAAYAVLLAVTGVGSLAYVSAIGRDAGLLPSWAGQSGRRSVRFVAVASGGLVVAPVTRPRSQLMPLAPLTPISARRPIRDAAALQVRVASLRAPFWDVPPAPSLVDHLRGIGTFAPAAPAPPDALRRVVPSGPTLLAGRPR